MSETATAPSCIVDGCETTSSLSSAVEGHFWRFVTFYCGQCYEDLVNGADPKIDKSRIIVERTFTRPAWAT